MYRSFFKRVFDIVFSLVVLVATSPVWILAVLLLVLQNRGRVFFVQERPGLHEKPFRILKLKTMNDKRDASGNLLPDVQRMTMVGRILRGFSIDELPQLVNVLKGEMSLIGPRPLLFKYIPLYSAEQRRRHHVRPGITGLAQVNGRNAISWTKRFELDVYYVDHVSWRLDLEIFFKTLKKVFLREGVNNSNERPMYPFNGSN